MTTDELLQRLEYTERLSDREGKLIQMLCARIKELEAAQ